MKKYTNQQAILAQQKRINRYLAAVVVILGIWVSLLFYQKRQKIQSQINHIEQITQVQIHRENQPLDIHLKKISQQQWQIESPYQANASTAVVQAFLQRLTRDCIAVPTQALPRQPQTIATVTTNRGIYTIGELNTASDRVYVSHQQNLALCDKLVAAIALAPAIHFIDKNLYSGKLTALFGDYGSITQMQPIDLSVLDISYVSRSAYAENPTSQLTLQSSDGMTTYSVSRSQDGQYLLLFSAEKELMYAIAYQASIAAILGF